VLDVVVVDGQGRPLAGVDIEGLPRFHPWPVHGFAGRLPDGQEAPDPLAGLWRARSDELGRARLALPVPARATAQAGGEALRGAGAPAGLARSPEVQLAAPRPEAPPAAPNRIVPRQVGVAFAAPEFQLASGELRAETLVGLASSALGPRGVVVDAQGQALEGVELVAYALAPLGAAEVDQLVQVLSDGSGAFSFAGQALPSFPLEVRAELDGFLPARARVEDPSSARLEASLELQLLGPAEELRGRVLDPAGEPVAGARVEARAPDAVRDPHGAVSTDADGAFRSWVLADAPVALQILPPAPYDGWVPATLAEIEPGEPRDGLVFVLDLAPQPSGVVEAEIVDRASGEARDAAQALLLPFFLDAEREPPIFLGSRTPGRVQVDGVPPGLWNLWVRAHDGTLASSVVRLGPGEQRAFARLELGGPARLDGRVADAEGAQLVIKSSAGLVMPALADVQPFTRAVALDADGGFLAEGLGSGPVFALVERAGEVVSAVSLELAPGDNGFLDLSPEGLGRLRVVGAAPSPAGVVALWLSEGEDRPWRIAELALADGQAVVALEAELRPGSIRWQVTHQADLRVDAPSTAAVAEGSAAIAPGETTSVVFAVQGL
jgi:hypothetical protein